VIFILKFSLIINMYTPITSGIFSHFFIGGGDEFKNTSYNNYFSKKSR